MLPAAHVSSPGPVPGTGGVFPQALLEQAKALELQGVIAAEAGNLGTALERFGQAIHLLPERASAYNNRAQARRLQGDVAGEGRGPGIPAEGALECTDQRRRGCGAGVWGEDSLSPSGICILICKRYIMGPANLLRALVKVRVDCISFVYLTFNETLRW